MRILAFIFALGILPESSASVTTETAQYAVNTPNCQIPELDPYDKSVSGMYEKWKPLTCSSLPPLTTVAPTSHNVKRGMDFSHTLILLRQNVHQYRIRPDELKCCYRLIERDTTWVKQGKSLPDDGIKITSCIEFVNDTIFHGNEEFIWVGCYKNGVPSNSENKIYENLHAFIGNKENVRRKKNGHSEVKRRVSVMIIGIDSMSRLNLMRTMPKTVEHMERSGWFSMKGFNKMGENTKPNLMAALAGLRFGSREVSCRPGLTNFDKCPMIWKEFSDEGYVTAYGEDDPFISTFNYLSGGFTEEPTDYYLRPFIWAGVYTTHIKRFGQRIGCYGPTKVADHIFNYALDFTRSFQNQPTFSIFWQNGFSHENLNSASAFDDTVLSFFQKLDGKVMNRTIIFFLSDHGMRFGRIRETFLGYLEDRLPFFYLWVPEGVRTAHPHLTKNLAKNSNRLISHFDVYRTLMGLLGKNKTAPGCPKCKSIFDLIPWNRSCDDAGIQDHWCSCAQYTEIQTSHPIAKKLAELVVHNINKVLKPYSKFTSNGTRCAVLKKRKVISLRKKMPSGGFREQIIVVVQTVPGNGKFEATVSYDGERYKVIDGIARVDRYDQQSMCVNHHFARKYCYCIKIVGEKSR